MPNWCSNKITFHEDADEIFKVILKTDEEGNQYFDFNTLIPTPDNIYQGNVGKAEEEKYGKENCWYEWNLTHWGTKWNACHTVVEGNVLYFDTAWSDPQPIIIMLCKRFNKPFNHKYVEEGCFFWGEDDYTFNMFGDLVKVPITSRDDDGSDLYLELVGYDPFDDEEHES